MKHVLTLLSIVLLSFCYSQTAEEYYLNGYNKLEMADYYGAIRDLDKAIELNPDHTEAYFYRGLCKSQLRNFAEAMQDYNKVIALDPNNDGAYLNRGVCKLSLGDKYGACMDWSLAGEKGSSGAYDMIKNHCQ